MAKLNLEELAEVSDNTIEQNNDEETVVECKNDIENDVKKKNEKQDNNKNDVDIKNEKKQVNIAAPTSAKPNPQEKLLAETNKIFSLPFEVARKNLKVEEEELRAAGEQLFTKGFFEKEYELPFGMTVVFRSKRAMEELDYYAFLSDAINKNLSMDEFNYILSIRNIAHVLKKVGDKDFSKASFEDKFDYLMGISSPLLAAIQNQTKSFWAILMLMTHKGFVGFLMK